MIGIITFQDTTNYGAMLQTYALQKAIGKLGIKTEVINYENDFISRNEQPLTIKRANGIREYIKYFLLHKSQDEKYRKFKDFYKNYIVSSKRKYDCNSIIETTKRYHSFLAGSDQIWNAELTNFDFNYLLEFADGSLVKNSYASSLGGYVIPDDYKERYKACLSSFNSLNIRERDGAEQIGLLCNMNTKVVVDPTLLLEQVDWDVFISERLIKEEYILVYFIDRTAENLSFIRKYAKKKHLKIVYLNSYLKSYFGMNNNRTAGPIEFLNLMKYASIVYTGSFHGLCFSLIFNKNFYLTNSPAHGRQSRIDNLLEAVGVKIDEVDKTKMGESPNFDYDYVNYNREMIKKDSLKILYESISL